MSENHGGQRHWRLTPSVKGSWDDTNGRCAPQVLVLCIAPRVLVPCIAPASCRAGL